MPKKTLTSENVRKHIRKLSEHLRVHLKTHLIKHLGEHLRENLKEHKRAFEGIHFEAEGLEPCPCCLWQDLKILLIY